MKFSTQIIVRYVFPTHSNKERNVILMDRIFNRQRSLLKTKGEYFSIIYAST